MTFIIMKQAFSLAELSIVLIIVGLLVTGISAGSKLVEQAKLRHIINEVKIIEKNIGTFIVTYNSLPGDLSNAFDFFGSSCHATASYCNGNGDNIIKDYHISRTSSPKESEVLTFWQHLQLATIISESYTNPGDVSSGLPTVVAGVNGKASNFNSGIYSVSHYGVGSPTTNYTNNPGNPMALYILLGKEYSGSWQANAVISPYHLELIDRKIDDGNPDNGKVIARGYYVPGTGWIETDCHNPVDSYVMSTTDIKCTAYFKTSYN